jgi:hypothetical protein
MQVINSLIVKSIALRAELRNLHAGTEMPMVLVASDGAGRIKGGAPEPVASLELSRAAPGLIGKQKPMQKPLLYRLMLAATGLVSLCGFDCAVAPGLPNSFTRLKQLPAPKIVASAEAYPGGNYNVGNIIDGKTQTEYSSNGKGTNTFIEFDFGAATGVAAFRHLDRNDPATIAASAGAHRAATPWAI